MKRCLFSLLLVAVCLAPVDSHAQECPEPVSVRILSRVGDSGRATAGWKRVRAERPVRLYAELTARVGGEKQRFGDPVLGRGVRAWPEACPALVSWEKVEAEPESYANHHSLPPADLAYAETAWTTGWTAQADVHPTLMHDDFEHVSTGYGVMRYRVTVRTSRGDVSTPGSERRRGGAIAPDVHAVAYRPDDTALGYIHELFNTPYIYGSKSVRGGHQVDRLVGSDCADFAVYGRRRQRGRSAVPYTYTGGLWSLGRRDSRWRVTLDEHGLYRTKEGRTLAFGLGKQVRPGDLLNLEGGHVLVLYEDDGDGVLGLSDIVVHTYVREPEVTSIKNCRWGALSGKEVIRLR